MNAIAVGWSTKSKTVHVICDDAGLCSLPEPISVYRDGGGNLRNGAFIAMTVPNLVALRLAGVLSDKDISAMKLKGSVTP